MHGYTSADTGYFHQICCAAQNEAHDCGHINTPCAPHAACMHHCSDIFHLLVRVQRVMFAHAFFTLALFFHTGHNKHAHTVCEHRCWRCASAQLWMPACACACACACTCACACSSIVQHAQEVPQQVAHAQQLVPKQLVLDLKATCRQPCWG